VWACRSAESLKKECLQVCPVSLEIASTLFRPRANWQARCHFGSLAPHRSPPHAVRFDPSSAISHSCPTCLAGLLEAPVSSQFNSAYHGTLELYPRFVLRAACHC